MPVHGVALFTFYLFYEVAAFLGTLVLRPRRDFLAQCAALLDLWSVSGDE